MRERPRSRGRLQAAYLRLDTGKWGDVSLPALQAMGQEIAREKPELGRLTLFDPGPITPALFTWDATNRGSYKGAPPYD